MPTKYSTIEEFKKAAIEETRKWYQLGIKKFPQDERPLDIDFELQGTTAGKAWTNRNGTGRILISYNLTLAMENQETFLDDTVPHEVAHPVANDFFRLTYPLGCEHNDCWSHVMRVFGKTPRPCHSYDVSNVERVKYARLPADDI